MDLQIEGRHFHITEAIEQNLREKLGKLEHYFNGIHRMHAILAVEKSKRQIVELVCTVGKRHTLFAKGESDDMYVAIDKAEKKMLSEMKKYKDKSRAVIRGKRNGNGEAVGVTDETVGQDDEE